MAPEFLHIISETLPRRDPKTWVSLLRTRALDFFGASLDASSLMGLRLHRGPGAAAFITSVNTGAR